MTREEHLTARLAEECSEVAVRCSKANNFGPTEVYPSQPEPKMNNAELIRQKVWEVLAVYGMLEKEFGFPHLGVVAFLPAALHAMEQKVDKVNDYFAFSAARGRIVGYQPNPDYPHPEAEPECHGPGNHGGRHEFHPVSGVCMSCGIPRS